MGDTLKTGDRVRYVHDGRVGTVEQPRNSMGCVTVRFSDKWGDRLSTNADSLERVKEQPDG